MKYEVFGLLYKVLAKPLFFSFDPELVHNTMVSLGSLMGKSSKARKITNSTLAFSHPILKQKIAGMSFSNPIGLSAGFDYNANLTDILPNVGFGFESVGTVTNIPYEGNPKPRLGRLPKSKSLLVNKGYKSDGADVIAARLRGKTFSYPLGISIGRSNSATLTTLEESMDDIVSCLEKLKKANLKHAYWELNISCPNLIHGNKSITFYPPRNLNMLLAKIDKLKLTKPLFIKMPISENNSDFDKMLNVIVKHRVSGIIIGNLQKDRTNPVFDKAEIKNAPAGNFSGKPCFARSNELIFRAYKKYGNKLVIIGVGGVFNAHDAYEKIKRGASLVMLITGMIYEGPQLIGKINRDLADLVREDGYDNVSSSVGSLHSS